MLKNYLFYFICLVKQLKRKKEVDEYWEKINATERKQINREIDERVYEELIQKQIILCINKIIKINKKKSCSKKIIPYIKDFYIKDFFKLKKCQMLLKKRI